jgi:predicted ATP-grasp superfamily ATP-dependent carboligase
MDILPTWSLTTGPKKRKRVLDIPDSGNESDAPIVNLLASEKSLSKSVQSYAHCYDEGDEMTKFFMSI